MPSTSENTFGNRLEHARTLYGSLKVIVGYAPDNPALAPLTFKTFLDTVQNANDLVATTGQTLSDARVARRTAYFGDAKNNVPGLRTLAGRVRDAVGAMPGGKKSPSYKQIQRLTQKISNYHQPTKPATSSPGTTATEKKKISQSEASYGSMIQAGRDLAAAASKVPGYNPAAVDLKPAGLTAAMDNLAAKNEAVATALVEARNAASVRLELYEADHAGLTSQFQQAKAAVASQFGRRSNEYKSVAGIKY